VAKHSRVKPSDICDMVAAVDEDCFDGDVATFDGDVGVEDGTFMRPKNFLRASLNSNSRKSILLINSINTSLLFLQIYEWKKESEISLSLSLSLNLP
jgi:hypothetical protein